MSFSRKDLTDNLCRLQGNGHWRYYVQTLQTEFDDKVLMLLLSDHPDEALRGECRGLMTQLNRIKQNSGTPTP